MTTNEMKGVIRRWVSEVWNGGNLGLADELMAADYKLHVGAAELQGPESFKQLCTTYRGAFGDMRVTIEDLVAEGDRVVWRFKASGTQTGQLFDLAPTGKKMEIDGFCISRFAGDSWVEDWAGWDLAGMLEQLGAGRIPGLPLA